uniref:Ymf101 n=1 Tax=Phytophthora chlamydospora TaxID=1692154 RepID=A0A7U3T1D7_9STRA|nr:ymf101 [Phytophthora chlamydospora]
MNKNKKFFTYKNKIILTNGSSLKITSIKYLKNYQLNLKIFKETKIITDTDINLNKNKLNFIKKNNLN